MQDHIEFLYDAATALSQGRRDLQEDAIATHFPAELGLGYVVLADGMGGHAAGEVASKIVVREVFDELHQHAGDPVALERNIGSILGRALHRANGQVGRYAVGRPELRGMGATLIAPLIIANRLYWISVGDSPMYLLRGARMSRLNQEHSMAWRMDRMVSNGQISQWEADRNPDRECLTSALSGTMIPEIDCRDCPLDLQDGDILIVSSDGLQTLDEARIATLVYENRTRPSAEISARLLKEIQDRDDPDQDNVSLCVLKVSQQAHASLPIKTAVVQELAPRTASILRTTMHLQVQRNGKRASYNFSSEREG